MSKFYNPFSLKRPINTFPNAWDLVAFIIVLGMLAAFVWGGKQMAAPYQLGQILPLSLDPHNLPKYALFTILRLFTAMVFSLLFTFTIGTLAAKNKRAESIIIPCIDILQSVHLLQLLT